MYFLEFKSDGYFCCALHFSKNPPNRVYTKSKLIKINKTTNKNIISEYYLYRLEGDIISKKTFEEYENYIDGKEMGYTSIV